MKTRNKLNDDVVKAMKRGSRELQFERNGGGQFVAISRPHKNKKKYDRKRDKKKIDFDLSLFLYLNIYLIKYIIMRNIIRITEDELNCIISESVHKILTELDWKTYQNAANKDYNPKRASKFAKAASDAFNKEYEYDDDSGNYVGMKSSGLYDKDNMLRVRSKYEKPSKYGDNIVNFTSKDTDDTDDDNSYSRYYDNIRGVEKKPTTIDKRHARQIQKAYDEFENYRNGKLKYVNGKGWDKPEKSDFHSFIDFKMK